MKKAMIFGTIAASAWLGTLNNGFASTTGEDLLIGGQTSFDEIQYDAQLNLLKIAGGKGDDRIEVALADDGGILINGISAAKLGLRLPGIPLVAIQGGGGNDVLIAGRLPFAAMNGGDGEDILVWDNSDREFDRAVDGNDLLLWNDGDDGAVYGGAGLDVLIGNTGADRDQSFGDLGNDWIVGGTGQDSIVGGWGNDWISGGTGQDGI